MSLFIRYAVIATSISWSLCLQSLAVEYDFVAAQPLPSVTFRGQSGKIHTQGLYVTDQYYFVTGRWEQKPKRALLMRFSRSKPVTYQVIDITPPSTDGETLDHPGGFDVDDRNRLWIPISTSHRRGPSVIRCYDLSAGSRLSQAHKVSSFQVPDHIGALCWLSDESLVGANWDTEDVYTWRADGTLVLKVNQRSWISATTTLAVQDWKRLDDKSNQIIMGGLDKSQRPSQAVVRIVDNDSGKVKASFRLPARSDVARPVTNEGLAVHRGELFLLPEDIGHGAKVLRYRMKE